MGSKPMSPKNIIRLNKSCQVRIFLFLDPVDAASCLRVSKPWRKCVSGQIIWLEYSFLYLEPPEGLLYQLSEESKSCDGKYAKQDSIINSKQFGRAWTRLIRQCKLNIAEIISSFNNAIIKLTEVNELSNSDNQTYRITVSKTIIERSCHVLTLINERKFIEAMDHIGEANDLYETIKFRDSELE